MHPGLAAVAHQFLYFGARAKPPYCRQSNRCIQGLLLPLAGMRLLGRRIAGGGHRHRPIYEIEAGDSWRRSAHRRSLFASITSPWRRSVEKRQADCDSGAGHLLAIIKPKIVRHTIILSTNNLFLLASPTSLSDRLAKPAVINHSIRSSRSLLITFRVISPLVSSTFDAFFYDIAA